MKSDFDLVYCLVEQVHSKQGSTFTILGAFDNRGTAEKWRHVWELEYEIMKELKTQESIDHYLARKPDEKTNLLRIQNGETFTYSVITTWLHIERTV